MSTVEEFRGFSDILTYLSLQVCYVMDDKYLTLHFIFISFSEKGENIGAEFDFAYWIGATNRAGQGQWKWESTGEPLNFQMWVSKWSGWVDEIESPSCALIDTSESHQWMFWPCAKDFFMTGKRHTVQTKIGFICEKESKRARKNKNQSKKDKRRRKQRRKGRRNFHRRHWRKYLV